MSSDATALRHNAFVYESYDEYLARAVPFLKEGLQAGEGAIVANTKSGMAVMRVRARPTRMGSMDRIRGGLQPVLRPPPAWVLCSYDANGTPDPIIEGVWQTHPEVVDGDTWSASKRYEDPDHLMRRITPPPEEFADLRSIPTGRNAVEIRERLAPELIAAGLGEAKTLEMLLAATEIATNAIQHGGGVEEVRVGRAHGRFVCEIIDRGRGFDDPAAGYLAPRAGVGRGLWVARQLTWRIDFFPSRRGFTARIWL